MTGITIGADPEFFVKRGGVHVSAHNLIPGTKKDPWEVKKGAVQVDGMALEFNIDPAETAEEFDENITQVINHLRDMVDSDYTFDFSPVATFTEDYMKTVPEAAKVLGCEPDYNAYTGLANPAPDAKVNFRTASGHIHIGWTEDADPFDPDHFLACRLITKQLDYVMGMGQIFWDEDEIRPALYGKAGAFRPKPYGVEYRVLSNAWLASSALRKMVFDRIYKSTELLMEGKRFFPKKLDERFVLDFSTNSVQDRWSYFFNFQLTPIKDSLYNAFEKRFQKLLRDKAPKTKYSFGQYDFDRAFGADANLHPVAAAAIRVGQRANIRARRPAAIQHDALGRVVHQAIPDRVVPAAPPLPPIQEINVDEFWNAPDWDA